MSEIVDDRAIKAPEEFVDATNQVGYCIAPGSDVVRFGTHQRMPAGKTAEPALIAQSILNCMAPQWRRVHDRARLRRIHPDGIDTDKSPKRGAMALAQDMNAGLRVMFNHQESSDIDEQFALELFAASSFLARWVNDTTLGTDL